MPLPSQYESLQLAALDAPRRHASVQRYSLASANGERQALDACLRALAAGKLVSYPTESSYALGCDATNEKAVATLLQAKRRFSNKEGLPVIVGDLETIARFAQPTLAALALAKRFMPGPLSLLLHQKPDSKLAPSLSRDGVVFRIPQNTFARGLAAAYGKPIVSTSANMSGQQPLFDPDAVANELGDRISILVDAGPLPERLPSTIVDARGPFKILRQGAVPREEVARAIRSLPANNALL